MTRGFFTFDESMRVFDAWEEVALTREAKGFLLDAMYKRAINSIEFEEALAELYLKPCGPFDVDDVYDALKRRIVNPHRLKVLDPFENIVLH